MDLSHKVGGWVFDRTRKQYSCITEIDYLHQDDEQWLNYGAPDQILICLRFKDKSFTQFLPIDELNELYPYIGTDVAAIEVLYG